MCVGVSAEACNTDNTPSQPHRNPNTHRTKNNTTNVVNQQNSCKLLMMDILMSETCWAHKKWNKITSDIKLVIYSSTVMACCLNTYLLTPWCIVLPEKLTGLQLAKKFPAFHGTHKRTPPVPILGQPNPVHMPTSHLLEIHPNIIHPSTPTCCLNMLL